MKKLGIIVFGIVLIISSFFLILTSRETKSKKAINEVYAAQPIKASSLDSLDFIIFGKHDSQIDSSFVISNFGQPYSVNKSKNPFSEGAYFLDWSYKDVSILMNGDKTIIGFTLNTNRYKTYRGICVGDSIAKVKRIYWDSKENTDEYFEDKELISYSDKDSDMHVIRFIKDGVKVSSIYIGYLVD